MLGLKLATVSSSETTGLLDLTSVEFQVQEDPNTHQHASSLDWELSAGQEAQMSSSLGQPELWAAGDTTQNPVASLAAAGFAIE
mmetsp:Transcript_12806/g.30658  ORF Transcript_12806/g.30658 Transcript_12806/m.30658 type:complete len:84 (-) Transcript_12806:496-747(-)